MRFQDVVKFVHEGIYRRNFVSVKEKLGKKKKTTRVDALVLRIEGKP